MVVPTLHLGYPYDPGLKPDVCWPSLCKGSICNFPRHSHQGKGFPPSESKTAMVWGHDPHDVQRVVRLIDGINYGLVYGKIYGITQFTPDNFHTVPHRTSSHCWHHKLPAQPACDSALWIRLERNGRTLGLPGQQLGLRLPAQGPTPKQGLPSALFYQGSCPATLSLLL